jgi:drug/metabolite transporter (DMT)-like permease
MRIHPILLAVLASFFFASSTFLSKLLGSGQWGDPLNPLQIAHARFAFGLMTAMVLAVFVGLQLTRPHFKLHVLRSACGWIGIAILFTGVLYIPASDAVALTFLNPIFAMVFAVKILMERIDNQRWWAAAIALFGGILLIRPEANGLNLIALLCIFGAIIIGVEIVVIKLLTSREGVFQILVINNTIAALLATVPLMFVFVMPTATQWLALTAVGVIMVIGQLLFLFAMKAADASLVSPFIYSTLIFVGTLDYFILDVQPDSISLFGGALIIASGSYIALKENSKR